MIFFRQQHNKTTNYTKTDPCKPQFVHKTLSEKLNCSLESEQLLLELDDLLNNQIYTKNTIKNIKNTKKSIKLVELKEIDNKPHSLRFYDINDYFYNITNNDINNDNNINNDKNKNDKLEVDVENFKLGEEILKTADFVELEILSFKSKNIVNDTVPIQRNCSIELNYQTLSDNINNNKVNILLENICFEIFSFNSKSQQKIIVSFNVKNENVYFRANSFEFLDDKEVKIKNVGPLISMKFKRVRVGGVVTVF